MARYVPRHSATARERAAEAPVRRASRTYTAAAFVVAVGLTALVIATSGGWGEAIRALSGEALKQDEAQLMQQDDAAQDAGAEQGGTAP
jgi:hypothetical protein